MPSSRYANIDDINIKSRFAPFPYELKVHPRVQDALNRNEPVVALESTIIAHGMPYPENLQCATDLENAVLHNGATPATVAVIRGVACIGLDKDQLQLLATDRNVLKLARRDLAPAIAQRQTGATTVSATMFLSSSAGITVFATGGIGGVHRGVNETFDISSDIHALATIPQLVVCAGVKSVLDIPKTLEALETASVPVLVLNSRMFPAFYTRDSGLPSPHVVKTEQEVSSIFYVASESKVSNGVLLAVPVPRASEANSSTIQRATEKALNEMKKKYLLPKQATPFLLKRIAELTGGASLTTNMALAKNNASVAARIAVHLRNRSQAHPRSKVGLELHSITSLKPFVSPQAVPEAPQTLPNVVVIGGCALDIHCQPSNALVMKSSNAGRIKQTGGGVGKNVAEAAQVLGGARVKLISCVGDDVAGGLVLSILQRRGMNIEAIKQYKGKRTGVCCVIHENDGDMKVAVADFEDLFRDDESFVQDMEHEIKKWLGPDTVVVFDGNLNHADMRLLTAWSSGAGAKVWFEPTTSIKCKRAIQAGVLDRIDYISPNESELIAMASAVDGKRMFKNENTKINDAVLGEAASRLLGISPHLRILCTRGAAGVTKFYKDGGKVKHVHFSAVPVARSDFKNSTGAGDCFAGRCIAGLARGETEESAIRNGIKAAGGSCRSDDVVPNGRIGMAKL